MRVYVWHSAILKLIQTHSYTRMDGSGTMFEMCDYATRADYEIRKTEHTREQPQLVGVHTGGGCRDCVGTYRMCLNSGWTYDKQIIYCQKRNCNGRSQMVNVRAVVVVASEVLCLCEPRNKFELTWVKRRAANHEPSASACRASFFEQSALV